MRGLVITGGRAPEPRIIARYAETCDLCVAADSGLDTAIAAGIVPDYAVGDMDSLTDRSLLSRLREGRVITMPRDKDATDTELALGLLRDKGCAETVLIGGSGGRLDHILALRALFDGVNAPSVWVGEESLAVTLGARFPFRRIELSAIPEDEPISVFAVGAGPHALRGTGLRWPVDDLRWDSGAYSLSNRRDGTPCEIEAKAGSFIVILDSRAIYSLS